MEARSLQVALMGLEAARTAAQDRVDTLEQVSKALEAAEQGVSVAEAACVSRGGHLMPCSNCNSLELTNL